MIPSSLVAGVARAFAEDGVDLEALGLAWARVAPTVVLVPAFGLRALPAPARGVLGLALAASVLPAMTATHGAVAAGGATPWPWLLVGEALHGLPVAVATAVPLWAATMTGGVVDALRGSQDAANVPVVEGRATPLGVPLSLLASALFFSTGGPARAVRALGLPALEAEAPLAARALATTAHALTSGIALAVALAAPLLVASVVLEIAAALVARAAAPAQIHTLLAPVRAACLLAVFGLVLERLAGVLAQAMTHAP